jgi:RNA polymerase II-associated factor 1
MISLAIQAPAHPPPVHAGDKPLLRPLATLGKPNSQSASVSFLRRTEYISAEAGRSRYESSTSRSLMASSGRNTQQWRKKRRLDEDENDPTMANINMIRNIVKGFDIAYPHEAYNGPDTMTQIRGAVPTTQELAAWNTPRHPANPHLKLVDSYPVLPDVEGVPGTGAYTVVKFSTMPIAPTGRYDSRLDVGVLIPLEELPFQVAEYQASQAAYDADKSRPVPGPVQDFIHLVPEKSDTVVSKVKRKYDLEDAEREEDELYTARNEGSEQPVLEYEKLRLWETGQSTLQVETKYAEVAIALSDYDGLSAPTGASGKQRRLKQKAAYYYPIQQRINLRPLRPREGIDRASKGAEILHVIVREPGYEEEVAEQVQAEAEEEPRRTTTIIDSDDE